MSRRTGSRRTIAIAAMAMLLMGSSLAACGDDDDTAGGGDSGSDDAVTLPIGTLEDPATLPLFDDIPAVASDAEVEDGTLEIYNYNDYLNPELIEAFEEEYGVKVEVTGYDSEDQALSKVQSGAVEADLLIGHTFTTLPRFAAGQLLQPLNPDLLPNSSNVIGSLKDPFYDVGAQYTRPYIIYKTGIGYRADKVDPAAIAEEGWAALWNPEYDGYVGLIDDKREAISLALLYRGETDLNTDDQAKLDRAVDDLDALVEATNARVDSGIYQKLPEATFHVAQAWSGDVMLGLQYLGEDEGPEVLGFWNPPVTPIGNDLMSVLAGAEHPVLAHKFIDFLMDPANAQLNFEFVGYQPALTSPSPQELVDAELIPENLRNSVVTEQELADGLREYALDAKVEKQWEDAWSTFTAG